MIKIPTNESSYLIKNLFLNLITNIPALSIGQMGSEEELAKYKTAGRIAQHVLDQLIPLCTPNENIMQLCIKGDQLIEQAISNSSDGIKNCGIAFPTCISVDNVICHFSPCLLDEVASKQSLEIGSLVKIELGVHVDGYPALVGTSFICSSNTPMNEKPDAQVSLKTKLIETAYEASQAVLKVFELSETDSLTGECCSREDNYKFNDIVCEIAKKNSFIAVQGALSYQIGRNSFDFPKQIPVNLSEGERQKVPRVKFCSGECFVIDIVLSSGDGKIRASSIKSSLFRPTPNKYNLRLATSRTAFTELTKKAGTFTFNIRNATDPKKMRIGMLECVSHSCVSPSEVLTEKDGSFVARFLYTIVLAKDGPLLVTRAEK